MKSRIEQLNAIGHIVDKAELAPGTESLEDIDTTPIRNKLAELANRAGELLTALSIEISFTFTSSGMSKDKIEIDPFKITERIEKDLSEIGTVEQWPRLEGRQMVMVVAPKKGK